MQNTIVQDLIIYDALSITSNIHQVSDIIEILGLQDVPWMTVNGAKGFKYRLYYDCISIHFCRDDDYIWLELTGQGCRAFESYGTGDYDGLFQLVHDNPQNMKITRLDVAFDDHSGVLDIERIRDDTRNGNFISFFKKWKIEEGSDGICIYHGSKSSEILIRIYDKAAEKGYTDGRHWVRVEVQFRRDRAMQFVFADGSLVNRFCGVLSNYLRFVIPNELDSNKRRWETCDYWCKLLNNALPLSLYVKPGTEYNMINMANYVFKQGGNAIDATIQILGVDGFLDELHARETRPNPKYSEIVRKMKGEQGSNGNY